MNNQIFRVAGFAIFIVSLRYFFIEFLEFTDNEYIFALIFLSLIVFAIGKLFE